jgi:hypothetical protein
MITDDSHPRMIRAHKALLSRVGELLGDGTKELTTGLLHDLFEIIRHHRAECRREHDLDFPALVVAAIPRLGILHFMRADLDIASIKQQIINVTRLYPQVQVEELVSAFRMAFPDIKQIVVLENKDSGDKATERSAERAERITQEAEKIVEENPDIVKPIEPAPKLSWEK